MIKSLTALYKQYCYTTNKKEELIGQIKDKDFQLWLSKIRERVDFFKDFLDYKNIELSDDTIEFNKTVFDSIGGEVTIISDYSELMGYPIGTIYIDNGYFIILKDGIIQEYPIDDTLSKELLSHNPYNIIVDERKLFEFDEIGLQIYYAYYGYNTDYCKEKNLRRIEEFAKKINLEENIDYETLDNMYVCFFSNKSKNKNKVKVKLF